jgi:hypothetical protein
VRGKKGEERVRLFSGGEEEVNAIKVSLLLVLVKKLIERAHDG